MNDSKERTDVLEVLEPQGQSREIRLLGKPMVIGRARSCDIWLADAAVSRRHAQMQIDESGRWTLQVLGRTNPTFVNERQVLHAALDDGDKIRVGGCELILRLGREESAEPFLDFIEAETLPLMDRPSWSLVGQYVELIRSLNRMDSADSVMERLAQGCLEMCQARQAAVGLFGERDLSWHACVSQPGIAARPPSVSELVRNRLRMASVTLEHMPKTGELREYGGGEVSGCLLFPIRSGGQTFGLLYLEVDPSARSLRKYECGLVRIAAMEAAGGLARVEAREVARDIEAAVRIIIGLLPKTLDIDPRLEVQVAYHPSAQVGGDYYDLMKTDQDHALFVIADAMGTGLPAAVRIANFQPAFRLAHHFGNDLKQIHEVLRKHVEDSGAPGDYVSGIIGLLDLRDGHLSLSIAGHPPAMTIRGKRVLPLSANLGTTAWGHPGIEYDLFETELARGGDILLMYTDGVTEAENSKGEQLRIGGLRDIVRRASLDALEEGVEGISESILRWCGRSLVDDLTLMAIRWKG